MEVFDFLIVLTVSVLFLVFIEEAAEILEPHIIAALSNETQHLILIGESSELINSPISSYLLSRLKQAIQESYREQFVFDFRCLRNKGSSIPYVSMFFFVISFGQC